MNPEAIPNPQKVMMEHKPDEEYATDVVMKWS
jgi:hypothetical protein